jgi:hypothetical protein
MNGWMWRPTEAEAINRQAPRAKGVTNRARNRLGSRPGPTGLGSFWPGSAPSRSPMLLGQLLTCSLMHVGP